MDQWTADSFENIGSKYVHTVDIVEHYVHNIHNIYVTLRSPDAFRGRIHVEYIFVQDPQDPSKTPDLC